MINDILKKQISTEIVFVLNNRFCAALFSRKLPSFCSYLHLTNSPNSMGWRCAVEAYTQNVYSRAHISFSRLQAIINQNNIDRYAFSMQFFFWFFLKSKLKLLLECASFFVICIFEFSFSVPAPIDERLLKLYAAYRNMLLIAYMRHKETRPQSCWGKQGVRDTLYLILHYILKLLISQHYTKLLNWRSTFSRHVNKTYVTHLVVYLSQIIKPPSITNAWGCAEDACNVFLIIAKK